MAERADEWDPAQYERFKAQRRLAFDDLAELCERRPGGTAVDLGCGTGALTAELHRALGTSSMLGVDRSSAMLARAPTGVPGLRFVEGDLAEWAPEAPVDVVFANASLHWVPDHPALLARLRGALAPGGQLAFQLPANFDHPSHAAVRAVAAEPRFARALADDMPADRGESVLGPVAYAELLEGLGADAQRVRLEIYGHRLASTGEVVEWVMGTLLRPYRSRLDAPTFEAFLERYRARVLAELGDRRPFFYPFPRILCWARFDR